MFDMNRFDVSERFAEMWKTSRADSGKSQEYVAKALGVSKKTIQNWEDGTSCPNQAMGLEWFHVLDLPPMPYYLKMLYPGVYTSSTDEATEHDIDMALMAILRDMPADTKRKFLYCISGEHGSPVGNILDLFMCYLHIPLRERVPIAAQVIYAYKITLAHKKLLLPKHVQPNIQALDIALRRGFEAACEKHESYYSNEE